MHRDTDSRLHVAGLRALGLAALGLGFTSCQAPVFEAAARAQMLTLGGEFGASSGGATATSDVETMGLDEDEYVFAPRLDAEFGPWHITGDAFLSSLSGTGTVDAQLSLGGITVDVGDVVESAIDLGYARAIATFDLIPTDMVDLAIGLGLVLADVSAEIEDVANGLREEVGEVIVGPVAAVHGRVHFGRATVGVAASGIGFKYEDVEVMHLDIDASAHLELLSRGGFAAILDGGYRYLVIDAAFNDGNDAIDANFNYSGPYIGIRLSF